MTSTGFGVHGAWVRHSATVAGSEPFETQHVIWVQAGGSYADIRVPFHPAAAARCFGGRSGWDGSRYRWSRHLDTEPAAGEDLGELHVDGDCLVERGLLPGLAGPVAYEERWLPLEGSGGPYLALEAPHGCMVQAGDHALTIVAAREAGGELRAAYRVRRGGGWALVHSVGAATDVPGPEDPPAWPVVDQGTAPVHETREAK